ncbi:MAG: DUF1294 domain-containing protein [Oscillospiraceae bacterium]|nr:DUF1294 domain-containing protein [Oscillospiraceae bacterium]
MKEIIQALGALPCAAVAWVLVWSVIAFICYGADKRKARKGRFRISEAALLILGAVGGAAGALTGMRAFRHKTKHWYFWAVNGLALTAHVVLIVWLFIRQ